MTARQLLSGPALATLDETPWQEPERTERLLNALARQAGTPREAGPLLDRILEALPQAPDPEMALLNLERWASRLVTPASTFALLLEHPRVLDDLLAVLGASQYLADILARDPWLYSLFIEPDTPRSAAEYRSEVESALRASRPAARRDALRRVKRREFLRTGWRDLARRAPLTEVIHEVSDLAEAIIAGALTLAHEEVDPRFPTAAAAVRFAVLAMGKLGARELNYSSDVDLVFVMEAPDPHDEAAARFAKRLAETLIAALTEETAEGRCFRVDMRLRPEGRSGALVRSYAAFREYYDRWAETWERQALIKVRPVAGDSELGRRFVELVQPVIYRRAQGLAVLEDVREMRAAVEAKLLAAGELERSVKEGKGTIRDVEFTLQLLQLLFGADRPDLRAADTLTALQSLEQGGVLSPEERRIFESGYVFFREVEHRLQLLNDSPVRLIPTDSRDLRRLARAMGFAEGPDFLAEVHRQQEGVRTLAETVQRRLGVDFSGPAERLRGAILLAHTSEGAVALEEQLAQRGFPDPQAAVEPLRRLAIGAPGSPHPSATRRLFADLASTLLDACSAAADPNLALDGLEQLAARKLLYRQFFQTLSEHPEGLSDLARFAGAAPTALRTVLRYPELAELITDQELLALRRSPEELQQDLRERLAASPSPERKLGALRRFKMRELVRLAARHALQPPAADAETAEWSDVAEALVQQALVLAVERLRTAGRWPLEDAGALAVFALGRFGGRDLHFASDLDLLYVAEPGSGVDVQQYELLAATVNHAVQDLTDEGRLFQVDLRLRPEGRQGFSVVTQESARRYYGEGGRAETWEFQTLTRARAVAGSAETAGHFLDLIRPRVYRNPMPEAWTEQIRRMKRRVERERATDATRPRNLKLGPGGLSDIEFAVQYLQLKHGSAAPSAQDPATLRAIAALTAAGALTPGQANAFEAGHAFLTTLRQALFLLEPDGSSDVIPSVVGEAQLARAAARAMALETPEALAAAYQHHTQAVRDAFLHTLGEPT
jgi:glutamate-ammonia-ligase adenylyltransferase